MVERAGAHAMRGRVALGVLALVALMPWMVGGEHESLSQRARDRVPGRFAKLKEGSTRYELQGPPGAPTVVLVHGISAYSFVWGELPRLLRDEGLRTLTYDLYGRGFSDRPWEDYDLELYVRQLDRLVRKLRIRGAVHVVGLSMGGLVATEYAMRFPERVASLVLVDPAGVGAAMPAGSALLQVPLVGDWLMQVAGHRVLRAGLARSVHDQSLVPGLEERFDAQLEYAGYNRAILSSLRHMPLEDFTARYAELGRVKVPVAVIWGKEDLVTPVSGADEIARLVPRAVVHRIDAAGHLPHYEKPAEVAAPLVEFLEENPPAPTRLSRRDRERQREEHRFQKAAAREERMRGKGGRAPRGERGRGGQDGGRRGGEGRGARRG